MVFDLARAVLAWCLILPAAYTAGSRFSPMVRAQDHLLKGIFFFALGFMVLSWSVVGLGAFGVLAPRYLWMMVGMIFASGFSRLHLLRDWIRAFGALFWGPEKNFLLLFCRIILALSFLALLLGTLTPEIGGDALTYQLNLPKIFLRKGSLAPDYFDFNSYFPLFLTNLYLIGLALGGVFAAKFFHFFSGFLLFLVIQRRVEKDTGSGGLAFFAGLIFWLTPTAYNMLSTTYIDVALSFYCVLAFVALLAAFEEGRAPLFAVSGILMGCAMSMKYLALMSVVALAAAALWETFRRHEFVKLPSRLALWTGGFLLICGYWFFRNWSWTGNPFFPYFGDFFGRAYRPPTDFHLFGMGRGFREFLTFFWNMALFPNKFGSFTTRIGFFYPILAPFLGMTFFFVPRGRVYAVYALAFLGPWFFMAQADRWVLPVLPVVILGGVCGLDWAVRCLSPGFRAALSRAGIFSAAALLLVYFAAGFYHYRHAYPLFVGSIAEGEYLRRFERTQDMALWVNRYLPKEAKILLEAEPRGYYFDRELLRNVYVRWRLRLEKRRQDPLAVRNLVRDLGVTHILTSDRVLPDGTTAPEAPSPLRVLAASPYWSLIVEMPSRNIRDDRYVYRLYEIR